MLTLLLRRWECRVNCQNLRSPAMRGGVWLGLRLYAGAIEENSRDASCHSSRTARPQRWDSDNSAGHDQPRFIGTKHGRGSDRVAPQSRAA